MSGYVRREPSIIIGEDTEGMYADLDGRRYRVVGEAVSYLRETYGLSLDQASGLLSQEILRYLMCDEGED